MVIVELYKDLLGELEMLNWLRDDLLSQLKRNELEVWGHSMPLTKSLPKYDNIRERLEYIETEIECKVTLKNKIESGINHLEGLEYMVAFKRDIEGKNITEIAEETKFSYSYISKVCVRINSAKSVQTQPC